MHTSQRQGLQGPQEPEHGGWALEAKQHLDDAAFPLLNFWGRWWQAGLLALMMVVLATCSPATTDSAAVVLTASSQTPALPSVDHQTPRPTPPLQSSRSATQSTRSATQSSQQPAPRHSPTHRTTTPMTSPTATGAPPSRTPTKVTPPTQTPAAAPTAAPRPLQLAGTQVLTDSVASGPWPSDPLLALMISSLHGRLLEPDPTTAALHPGLARAWQVEANRATFELRPDATWSDGSALTAGDVAEALRNAVTAGQGRFLFHITAIEAPDAQTVRLTFEGETAHCGALSEAAIWPIRDVDGVWPPRRTSGPYTVALQESDTPEGLPNWRFVPRTGSEPPFGPWDYRPITTSQELATAWQAGDVDLILGDQWLRGEPVPDGPVGGQVVSIPGPTLATLVFRNDHPLLGDGALRQALTTAIDSAALYQEAYHEPLPARLGALLPAHHWAAGPAAEPGNLESARARLEALGWRDEDGDGVRTKQGVPLRFVLLLGLSADARWESLALVLRTQWAALGVDMVPRYLEGGTLEERLHKDQWDMALVAYQVPLDPDQGAFWGANQDDILVQDVNVARYYNSMVAADLQQAARLSGCLPESRAPLYQKAWTTIAQERPMLFLFQLPQRLFLGPGIVPPALVGAGGWGAAVFGWTPQP